MIEFGRNLGKEIKRVKLNWFGICLIGGGVLVAGGADGLTSGEYRFNFEKNKCEKVLTRLDPPVYSLKNPTEVCVKLDQGVPASELIAKYEEQAQKDRPWGLARVMVGGGAAAGALIVGLGPIFMNTRKRYPEESSIES